MCVSNLKKKQHNDTISIIIYSLYFLDILVLCINFQSLAFSYAEIHPNQSLAFSYTDIRPKCQVCIKYSFYFLLLTYIVCGKVMFFKQCFVMYEFFVHNF